ncbi:hypothetical protein BpsM61_00053 [Bacillus phage vB_BpsM-61]|nr:hypothetical protein BpsM61_00053 [Bacillus phage vB_BpsM-61]
MSVIEYIERMPGSESFLALSQDEQNKWIFQSTEILNDHIKRKRLITDRFVALQVLYDYESHEQDFATLKRQGVESFSTEGMSVSFKDGAVAPSIMAIMEGRAGVGSLI